MSPLAPARISGHLAPMDLHLTAVLLVGFLAFAVFCGWRGARPPDPIRGPRMAPWRLMMLLSVAASVVLLIHLVHAGLGSL